MDWKRRNATCHNCRINIGAANLPRDVISDIVARLPMESVLKCRVVCKAWYAMTLDPCFIKKQASNHSKATQLILKALPEDNHSDNQGHIVLLDVEERKGRQIPIDTMFVDLQIMCTSDGLLCMASAEKLNPVVVYNPVTRERMFLPSSDPISNISHHTVGLGFDPSTQNYKVARTYTVSTSGEVKFEIISLGESKWRELCAPQTTTRLVGFEVLSWNGALYWTMKTAMSFTVIQLDLSDEKFNSIRYPSYLSSHYDSFGLMKVGESLTLVQGNCNLVSFLRLSGNKVGEDLSFSLIGECDMHVKWGGGFTCNFVCPVNPVDYLLQVGYLVHVGYLLQVGYWSGFHQRREHLTLYFPKKRHYLKLDIPGLPSNFKALPFKPSLVPLRAARPLLN